MYTFLRRLATNNIFIFILTWIAVFLIGLHIRLFPLRNYSPETFSERAALYVVNKMKERVAVEVNQKYPNITDAQRNFLTKKLFDDLFHRERDKVRKSIDQISQEFKKQSSLKNTPPYLLASDSYYFLYLTRKITETGHISPEIKGSKYFHPLMFAPDGYWEPITLYPYTGYFVYQVMKIFDPSVSLMYAVSFTSIVLTGIILVFFLLLCRLMKFSWLSTFIGSIFFILAPIFVKRSTFAWYDNDPPNIFFPILIFIFVFLGLKNLQNAKLRSACAILSALFLFFYAFFWQGWVFFLSVIALSSIVIITYQFFYLKDRTLSRNTALFFGLILIITGLVAVISFGFNDFIQLFKDGAKALNNFMTPQLSVWPDLYISVGELHKADFNLMSGLLGGIIVFAIFAIGILIALTDIIRKNKNEAPILLILILFSLISIKLTLGAQRFALLCVVPVFIIFIYAFDRIIHFLHQIIETSFKNQKKTARSLNIIIVFISLCSIYLPIRQIYLQIGLLLNPIYNDTWNKTFEKIKAETPENSIINTWWPPGHFIKAMADRRVTFDGATINVPQAYWILNFFSSTTEKEAVGILRMLNDSGNRAAEFLESQGLPTSSAVALLKQITQLDNTRANIYLSQILKDKTKTETLMNLTHKTPPPSYCLIYNEFTENSVEMGIFGQWNFKKIEEINANPELQKNVPARQSKEYINFLWDLAGGPIHHSPKLNQINQINQTAIFDENLQIDLDKMEAVIDSSKFGKGRPYSLFYLFKDNVVEKIQTDADLPYSVVLYPEENGLNAILLDRKIAQSILVRLYYFSGKGLKYFEKFSDFSDMTKRTRIVVFKIKWDEFERDLKIQ